MTIRRTIGPGSYERGLLEELACTCRSIRGSTPTVNGGRAFPARWNFRAPMVGGASRQALPSPGSHRETFGEPTVTMAPHHALHTLRSPAPAPARPRPAPGSGRILRTGPRDDDPGLRRRG